MITWKSKNKSRKESKKSRGISTKSRKASMPATATRMFHGVAIQTKGRCCAAAAERKHRRFLSQDAPSLPLSECTMPGQCQCVYAHFKDRRTEPRRDSDVGLPPLRVYANDRRAGMGRRVTDPA